MCGTDLSLFNSLFLPHQPPPVLSAPLVALSPMAKPNFNTRALISDSGAFHRERATAEKAPLFSLTPPPEIP